MLNFNQTWSKIVSIFMFYLIEKILIFKGIIKINPYVIEIFF